MADVTPDPMIELVRRFAGADPDEDTAILEMCLHSAKEWYEQAGVPSMTSDLYKMWVCNLAAWFYDNRGNGDNTHVPPYIVESVHQLRPVTERNVLRGRRRRR